MKFTLQKPTDLVLAVFDEALAIELSVLKTAVVPLGDWLFTFQIIGESHSVQVRHGDRVVLQEILACIDLPSGGHQQIFSDMQPYQFCQAGYTVDVQFFKQLELLETPMLAVEFPSLGTAVTQMHWQWTEATMRWWTLHTYPDEHQKVITVRTQSQFCF